MQQVANFANLLYVATCDHEHHYALSECQLRSSNIICYQA